MFTRNYYKYYARAHANMTPDNSIIDLFVETDGTTGPQFYGDVTTMYRHKFPTYWQNALSSVKQVDIKSPVQNNSNSAILDYGVVFGTGTVAPTIDDYTLSGDVVTGFSVNASNSGEVNEDFTNAARTAVYTITNSSDTEIIIGEIGIFMENVWQSQRTTGTSPAAYHHGFYMVERTVLETPVIIPSGGVGQITYTIQMNYPVG